LLLDELGLPDLTMRRLASTLEVQPSALYWHFPNKQALLASVADQIIARARHLPSRASEWMPAARRGASALLHFILGHVLHEQQRMQADSLGVVTRTHAADPSDATAGASGRDEFDFGIMLLLAGLERQPIPFVPLDAAASSSSGKRDSSTNS